LKVERLDLATIFVKDLDKATKLFSDLFETEFVEPWATEMDTRETIDPLGINLATPLTRDGVSAQVMERKGEGIVTLGFKVPKLDAAIVEMQSKGIRLLGREKIGNANVATFHPKDTCGAMILLAEYQEKDAAAAFSGR